LRSRESILPLLAAFIRFTAGADEPECVEQLRCHGIERDLLVFIIYLLETHSNLKQTFLFALLARGLNFSTALAAAPIINRAPLAI